MCKFLTGKSRVQQTDLQGVWKLLDNEVYKANDGKIYMAPRNMYSDFYTIPALVAFIAGSPVQYDTRCCFVHDQFCYNHEALLVTLTEEELKEKGFLRYSEKNKMWVCEDIPAEYLCKEKIGKCKANNLLYECMRAAGENWLSCALVRTGTSLNFNWYIYKWLGKVFSLDLNRVYDESYWREHVIRWQAIL